MLLAAFPRLRAQSAPIGQDGGSDLLRTSHRRNVFCRLKDFSRVATRYDKRAANPSQPLHSQRLSPSGCE